MLAAAYVNLEHVLCVLLLIARIGDVATTYLVTPNLVLEANPVVRKFGWPFALLTVGVAALPYLNTALAVVALMTSLLVSASNARGIWMARALGENEYMALLMKAAGKSKLSYALLGTAASSFFVALAGAVVLLFYPSPDEDWGFWLGVGIVLFAAAFWLHQKLFMVRLFRRRAVEAHTPALASNPTG